MVQNLTSTAHVNPSSMSINKTATMTIKPLQNKTFTPSHMTFTPSHNVTITSLHSMTVTPSHNMTVTPSHNMTVTPSHNMTVTPSHNMTCGRQTMPTPPVTPTPTPTPTSTPIRPEPGNFTVTTKNNTVCLFAYMAATFNVLMHISKIVYLPANATATGACANYPSDDKSFITLSWQSKEVSFNFTMHFVIVKGKNLQVTSTPRWAAANLMFSMKGPGLSETFHSQKEPLNEVSAPLGHAFLCKTKLNAIKLTAVNSSVNVLLMDVKFQPFEVENGQFSKKVDNCDSTPTPTPTTTPHTTPKPHKESHTVAIAVGCTLAGLVVIVAIGYLIGRRYRRNTSAGYRKL
ncbi:unnamed protein product [Porites evermanni]|uniref:Lysosome-associated membrane glycoprotein 5 n=1 Tax=Porites evermanni TaxID=104178 RepID=A0ABN8M164_9CNID|nr:unnamed protein product [Porites evermanni]